MRAKLTSMVLFVFLYCCIEGSACGASGFNPLTDHFFLGELPRLEKTYQGHHVNDVEIYQGNSPAGAFRGLNISDQIFTSNLETQIHEVPVFVASASKPLAQKSEETGNSGADSATNQSSRGRINLHDLFSLVGWALLGASAVLIPQAVIIFSMWWFDEYRAPFGSGFNIQKDRQR